MKMFLWSLALMTALLFAAACGDDDSDSDQCDPENPDCPAGEFCQAVQDAGTQCLEPLLIKGIVMDMEDDSLVSGALVQALDPNRSTVGTSDETGIDGTYDLAVPAAWNADGTPVAGNYTLAVQAEGYEPFPSALRPALPIDAASAVDDGTNWVVENPTTTVSLLPIQGDTGNLGAISGTIAGDNCNGVLVVAEASENEGYIGYSNSNCDYTIFNLPAGSYTVTGYAKGLQLETVDATVAAAETVTGVNIGVSEDPLSTVSGKVEFANAPDYNVTSIVLAVESTFVESLAIGQVPPGLRVGEVTSSFIFENVPDGKYVVLAAFENDGLVRDPDVGIGGTEIVHIEVPDPTQGNTIEISQGFKVTQALEVVSPGKDAPEQVTSPTPTFTWVDDSSEKQYEVIVRDAYGNEIWQAVIPGVTGSNTADYIYPGAPTAPALEEGMYYQFKVFSINNADVYISTTEDLRGVFFL